MAMTPDEDELLERQAKRNAKPTIEKPLPSNTLAVVLLTVLTLVLSGLGLFQHFQIADAQRALQDAKQELQDNQSRLAALEKELQMTEASKSEADKQIQSTLEGLDSEVRKLWDNVWKRSKERFEEQDKKLAALEADAKKDKSSDVELKKSIDALKKDLAQISGLAKKINELQTQSGDNAIVVSQIREEIGKLKKSVATNDEGVRSIDAFRRQMIRDLTALREAFAKLQKDKENEAPELQPEFDPFQ